jgi:GNAT superfamily N-acetyltransferase
VTGSRVEVDRPEPSAARDDPSGLVLRRVRPEDVADCLDVFYVALEDLDARSGRASTPRNPASLERLLGHLVTTDPERAWLAEGRRGVAGFGLAMQRETSWFLSFLFVRPEHQATGVGRRLLEACLPAGVALDRPLPPGGPSLGTCIDAIQPISAGLYSRYGMVPRVPLYACLGRPRVGALPGLPPSVESLPFETLGRIDHAGPGTMI